MTGLGRTEDVEQSVAVSAGPGREDREDEGRSTHLAHKAEHGVDLETGAILSVTVQDVGGRFGDAAGRPSRSRRCGRTARRSKRWSPTRGTTDATLVALDEIGVRSYVSEPERGRRCWQDKKTRREKALYGNRRRIRGDFNAAAGSWWSGLSRTSTRPGGCGGCGCAATRMCASGCSSVGQLLRPRSLQGRLSAMSAGACRALGASDGLLGLRQWTPAGRSASLGRLGSRIDGHGHDHRHRRRCCYHSPLSDPTAPRLGAAGHSAGRLLSFSMARFDSRYSEWNTSLRRLCSQPIAAGPRRDT